MKRNISRRMLAVWMAAATFMSGFPGTTVFAGDLTDVFSSGVEEEADTAAPEYLFGDGVEADTLPDSEFLPGGVTTEGTDTLTIIEEDAGFEEVLVDVADADAGTDGETSDDSAEKIPVKLEISPDNRMGVIYEQSGNSVPLSYFDGVYHRKLKITYDDGSTEYIWSGYDTEYKFTMDDDKKWAEGWQKIIYTHRSSGLTVERDIYVARVGGSVSALSEDATASGNTAGATADAYDYYSFTPSETGYYQIDLTNVSGSGEIEFYKPGYAVPETFSDISGNKKLTFTLTGGSTYYLIVKGTADSGLAYNITFGGLQNEMVLDQPYTVAASHTEICTFTPAASGFYDMTKEGGFGTPYVYDSGMKKLSRLGGDPVFLRQGTKYFIELTSSYSKDTLYTLTLTETAELPADVSIAWKDDNITYALSSGGKLTFSGTGGMEGNYGYYVDTASVTSIVIEEGITNMGTLYGTFSGWKNIVSVSFPSTLTSISPQAFYNCSSLATVTFAPGSMLESIGADAFYGTPYLASIQSEDFVMIGDIVLDYQGSAESVTIPQNARILADSAMEDKDTLKNIAILENLKRIDRFGIARCDELTEMKIPGNVTEIAYCGFYSDTKLKTVTIDDGVESIGEEAFYACSSLESITIPKSVTYIGEHAIGYSSVTFNSSDYTWTYNKSETKPTIYCYYRSAAYSYAKTNEIDYVLLDEKDLGNAEVTRINLYYSGDEFLRPTPTVQFAEELLTEGKDYTVQYVDNADGNKTAVIITGTGDYHGSQTLYVSYGSTDTEPDVTPAPEITPEPDVPADETTPGSGSATDTPSQETTPGSGSSTDTPSQGTTPGSGSSTDTPSQGTTPDSGSSTVTPDQGGSPAVTPTPVPEAQPTVTPAPDVSDSTDSQTQETIRTGTSFYSGNNRYKVTGTGSVSFTGVKKKNTTRISIPNSVKYKGVTFTVTAVEKKALYKNRYVTQISVGNKVKTIGDNAFAGCTRLKRLTIGSSVTSIGRNAMKGDRKLSLITIKSTKLKTVKANALRRINSKARIRVPSRKLKAYTRLLRNKGQGSGVRITK